MSKISKLGVFTDLESFYLEVGLPRGMTRNDFVKNIIDYSEEDDTCSLFVSHFSDEIADYSAEEMELYECITGIVRVLHKVISKGIQIDNLNEIQDLAEEAVNEHVYVTDFQTLPLVKSVPSTVLEANGFLIPTTIQVKGEVKSLTTDNFSDQRLIAFTSPLAMRLFHRVISVQEVDDIADTFQYRVYTFLDSQRQLLREPTLPIAFVDKDSHLKNGHFEVANQIFERSECARLMSEKAYTLMVDQEETQVQVIILE